MKAAAIFAVGTSVGGAPDAIREILKTESALDVYLVPGKQGAPDAADPLRFVEQIRDTVTDPRLNWFIEEAVEPFDLSEVYRQMGDCVTRIAGCGYERVYVGITGGTNPMNVSLFQAAMVDLRSEVIPLYVQSRGEAWQKSFVASELRDRLIAQEALTTARSGQIRIASRLAEHLPATGLWKFLKESLNALSQWDDFDYKPASHSLDQQARKSADYLTHQLLAPLAETVSRIAANARSISDLAKQIQDIQNFDAVATAPGWAIRVAETGFLLVADVLANANRRIVEGRYTDSVLRSYRAAECATHMGLLQIGIHPSRPDACPSAYNRYCVGKVAGNGLAFYAGLEALQSVGKFDLVPIEKSVRSLADTRNHTYLEHGYRRVGRDLAEKCFDWALTICRALLGQAMGERWREFEMRL